jgi:hypothetical protein
VSDTADVLVIGAAPVAFGGLAGVAELAGHQVASAVFVDDEDRWLVVTRGGDQHTARVVVATGAAPDVVGRLDPGEAGRFGRHPYHGVARRGYPNFFTVTDRRTAALVVKCLFALRDRGCTRIEVKEHVQSQYSRYIDNGLVRLVDKPRLADFEFSRAADRAEDDEEYRGSAVLTAADGTEAAVEVHLLAVFQPVDNMVRWSGRVQPSVELAAMHRTTNQPVRIRIADHEPVDAVLVDHDPWGGSHIVGEGGSPYPLPLAIALTQFEPR